MKAGVADYKEERFTDRESIVQEIKSGRARTLNLRNVVLAGADLRGVDLSMVDLSGSDLSNADLSGARLFKAKLNGSILIRARLRDAELTGADLSGANLEEVDLSYAGLGMSVMHKTRLFNARLDGATMTKSDLMGSDLRCASLRDCRMREADLTFVDFTSADMRGADISLSNVAGSSFTNADLRGARLRMLKGFEKATWIGTDIRDINFAGAYRVRRFIMDENYLKEFRDQGVLANFMYKIWWLTSDCGRSMTRWFLCTLVLVLLFAFLYTFCEIDYGDHLTWFSPIYYSVVTLTTLGYGDIVPASLTGQIIAMAEVVSGYVMLGGLISIFSNKVARRAE